MFFGVQGFLKDASVVICEKLNRERLGANRFSNDFGLLFLRDASLKKQLLFAFLRDGFSNAKITSIVDADERFFFADWSCIGRRRTFNFMRLF